MLNQRTKNSLLVAKEHFFCLTFLIFIAYDCKCEASCRSKKILKNTEINKEEEFYEKIVCKDEKRMKKSF